MINPERVVEVEWAGKADHAAYAVKLLAVTENRTGLLAGITSAISDMKTGIRDARATVAADNRGRIEVTVEVFDVKHLDKSSARAQRPRVIDVGVSTGTGGAAAEGRRRDSSPPPGENTPAPSYAPPGISIRENFKKRHPAGRPAPRRVGVGGSFC